MERLLDERSHLRRNLEVSLPLHGLGQPFVAETLVINTVATLSTILSTLNKPRYQTKPR